MKRLAIALLVLAAGLAAAAAPADAAKTYYFNTYDKGKDKYAGPFKTQKLVRGAPYVLQMRGTFSVFDPDAYKGVLCGAPEAQPTYKSPKVPNGPVVADAEYLFADVFKNCNKRPVVLTGSTIQVRTSRRYSNPIPIGGLGDAPAANHTYRYALIGGGRKATFRMPDSFTKDNYGRLRIRWTKAKASDCANNGWFNWLYADEAACVAATARS